MPVTKALGESMNPLTPIVTGELNIGYGHPNGSPSRIPVAERSAALTRYRHALIR
jgi:hypothetical protein